MYNCKAPLLQDRPQKEAKDMDNTSDTPELPKFARKGATRGQDQQPLKQTISLLLDVDVLAWLKKDGKGYQTRAN